MNHVCGGKVDFQKFMSSGAEKVISVLSLLYGNYISFCRNYFLWYTFYSRVQEESPKKTFSSTFLPYL
jgi:hypothetical protein